MDNKIIKRIQDLLARANSNSNENEAKIAMERAHKLLAKHNLSISEIEDKDEDEGPCTENKHKITFGGPWARQISRAIAKLYFCDMFFSTISGRKEIHTFIGSEINVEVARMVSDFVLTTIHKEAKSQANGSTPYLNSFRNSAASRIFERCSQLVKEAKADEMKEEGLSTGTAMVLSSLYQLEEQKINAYKLEHHSDLRRVNMRSKSSCFEGRQAGRAAGDKVSLRPNLNDQVRLK